MTVSGSRFLYAGCGYGGSCFPKDVKALCHTGRKNGYPMRVIEAVEAVNETQKEIVADKLKEALGAELTGKWSPCGDSHSNPKPTICAKHRLWSLSTNCSKPGQRFGLSTRSPWTKRAERSATKSLIAITSTKPPKEPTPSHWPRNGSNSASDWNAIRKTMRGNLIVDGRNIYDQNELADKGFRYTGIGKKLAE